MVAVMNKTLLTLILCALAAASLTLGACGDDGSGSTPAQGCDACADAEVCVAYLSDDATKEREECAPAPEACGDTPTCEVDTCRGAMYGLCDEGWIGVACSDTFPPPIVSCNE
jgi:hypothetical protein